jgi:hypothetical protein
MPDDEAARLLGRGGRMLGLAAVAHARGQRAGAGPWHVLSTETVAVAEQLLLALEESRDSWVVAAAVTAALAAGPVTAVPSWAATVWEQPGELERLGESIEAAELDPAFPSGTSAKHADVRTRGLAALAVALCRGLDGVLALGAKLGESDRATLIAMARLAAVQVDPGAPTRVRGRIRRVVAVEG